MRNALKTDKSLQTKAMAHTAVQLPAPDSTRHIWHGMYNTFKNNI